MVRFALAAILALPLGARTAAAQGDSTWREHNAAARAAYTRRDYATYRTQLLELERSLSGHSLVLYKLAAAEALLGNADAAVRRLQEFALTGLVAKPADDSDFVSLRSRDDFRAAVDRLARNARPVSRSAPAITIPEPRLVPEDIAFDSTTRTFYVSSMLLRKIVRVDRRGAVADFVRPGQDGIWSVLAVLVDPRRRLLWATTSTLERTRAFAAPDSGRGALLAYDLSTGLLRQRYDLPANSGHHELGELAIAESGDVFVSDGRVGMVYVLRRGASALEPLLSDGTLASPQGIAVRPDGRLFVADYVRGIAIVDPATRAVDWLPHPREVPLNGIDGLTLSGHALIAIQNGTTPPRVVRLELDEGLTRVTSSQVLEAGSVGVDEPTHGVIVGRGFYFIGSSGFGRLQPDGSVKAGAKLEPTVVRRIDLESATSSTGRAARADADGVVRECPTVAVPDATEVKMTPGIVYTVRGADTLRLDLARPARAVAPPPVVLLVHGGGWAGGDRSSRLREQMLRLVGMGYGVVSVDYRLVSAGRNTFPAAARDVVCAARWVRTHGGEHGLDGERVVAVGESSGGELAGLLGTAANRADLSAGCEHAAPATVRGVISMYGALDLRIPLGPDPAVARIVTGYLGDEPSRLPETARLASPVALVTAESSPFLLIHGANDASVAPAQSRAMRDALRSAGVPVTYAEVTDQAHGFPMLSDDPALRTATCAAVAFLERTLR